MQNIPRLRKHVDIMGVVGVVSLLCRPAAGSLSSILADLAAKLVPTANNELPLQLSPRVQGITAALIAGFLLLSFLALLLLMSPAIPNPLKKILRIWNGLSPFAARALFFYYASGVPYSRHSIFFSETEILLAFVVFNFVVMVFTKRLKRV